MKVIGKKDNSTYICEVHHTELEKFLGLFYNKLNRLEVGNVVNLGKGYEYSGEIKSALENTRKFIESNKKVVEAILNGLSIESIMNQEEN
jgi:hypothetical protein